MGRKSLKLICPKCSRVARETRTRYGLRQSCCDLWSWDRKPLVCADTHRARQIAHATFDPLWQKGLVKKARAYYLLATELKISGHECHMARMSKEEARKVPGAVASILNKIEGGQILPDKRFLSRSSGAQ